MTIFFIYLLKVIICSAVLTAYYFLCLRNKVFHQWNRFFLLLVVLLSLTVPLLQFTIFHTPEEAQQGAIKLLNAVYAEGEPVVILSQKNSFNLSDWPVYLYGSVSLILLCGFLLSLIKIFRLIRQNCAQEVQKILFINTEVKGTPFSFFHYIFWNKAIDINSQAGTQIFKHELVHVREWHTLDKLLMQVVLALFWCNPLFWVIRYELRMMHEFIADKKAVQQQDASQLAALILQTTYPKNFAQIINPFFHQSIKRRLYMLTKIQNPRINYLSRILILPLLAFLVLAFAVKTKTISPGEIPVKLAKKITVVIDAGHGGNDEGAKVEGLSEKELTLAIAQQIKALNSNKNMEIVLTRTGDVTTSLQSRMELVNTQEANLLVSIHVNAAPSIKNSNGLVRENKANGFEARIQQKTSFYVQSRVLGSTLMQSINDIYKTASVLKQSENDLYILKQAPCPAVIIECGYLTNKQDRAFIQQPANQKAIAQKILAGIEKYFSADNGLDVNEVVIDTLPKKKEIREVNVKKETVEVVFKDGTKEEITTKEAQKRGLLNVDPIVNLVHNPAAVRSPFNGLVIVNGNVYKGGLDNLDPDKIHSMNVMKGDSATKKYGEKGAKGVIEITLKKEYENMTLDLEVDAKGTNNMQIANEGFKHTFTKVEVDPVFPGSWSNYLKKNLRASVPVDSGAKAGTYPVVVQFIVDKDGSISDIKALTIHGFGMEEEVMRIIKISPPWLPAGQNGHKVRAYKKQTVTFVVSDEDDATTSQNPDTNKQ